MDNFKCSKVENIRYHSYNIKKEFLKLNAESDGKYEDQNKLSTNHLTKPFKTDFELLKAVEIFAELTCYSFKRINVHKERKRDIIFVCSSNSAKRPGNAACDAQSSRSRKRLISESCAMRLKFKWDKVLEHFLLTKDSEFNHNHEAVSKSIEVIIII